MVEGGRLRVVMVSKYTIRCGNRRIYVPYEVYIIVKLLKDNMGFKTMCDAYNYFMENIVNKVVNDLKINNVNDVNKIVRVVREEQSLRRVEELVRILKEIYDWKRVFGRSGAFAFPHLLGKVRQLSFEEFKRYFNWWYNFEYYTLEAWCNLRNLSDFRMLVDTSYEDKTIREWLSIIERDGEFFCRLVYYGFERLYIPSNQTRYYNDVSVLSVSCRLCGSDVDCTFFLISLIIIIINIVSRVLMILRKCWNAEKNN